LGTYIFCRRIWRSVVVINLTPPFAFLTKSTFSYFNGLKLMK
jgi:hypothetical protein